jgi:glucose-6-phosphate 1-epimerase
VETVLRVGRGGLEVLDLAAADGAAAQLCAQGAHVIAWRPAGGGERLFLSDRAEFKPGAAIRGGVPVIFPQFASEGPLPRHGFARTVQWRLESAGQGEARYRLSDSDPTRALWPHAFDAQLSVTLAGQALHLSLAVENRGGDAFSFTAALHTYLRVEDIARVELGGLQGLQYSDAANGGRAMRESAERVRIEGEVDRIYFDAPPVLQLREPNRRLRIESQGFADVVVWNPGAIKGAALADLDPDGYRRFLCVEAAAIGRPLRLAPGQNWTGVQTLVAEDETNA